MSDISYASPRHIYYYDFESMSGGYLGEANFRSDVSVLLTEAGVNNAADFSVDFTDDFGVWHPVTDFRSVLIADEYYSIDHITDALKLILAR